MCYTDFETHNKLVRSRYNEKAKQATKHMFDEIEVYKEAEKCEHTWKEFEKHLFVCTKCGATSGLQRR